MSESVAGEVGRRARELLFQDGVWLDQDQRELILTGWTKWPIILISLCVDDLHKTVYTMVYYDAPAAKLVFSDSPDDAELKAVDGIEYVSTVLDALRRLMLLEDLANA
jgi:hypothetical protein